MIRIKKLLLGLAIVFSLCSMVGTAQSAIIVDTGTTEAGKSWSLANDQWLAGEFTISQDYIITDLQGYMWGGSNSYLTAAIYDDGGDLPGSELYSNQFSVGATNGWYGASGQSWSLSAGTYWAAFEVRSGDNYLGSLLGSAITPLDNEAVWHPHEWSLFDGLSLGIRVFGDPAPVPEPSTIALFSLGVLGLAGVSRKKK